MGSRTIAVLYNDDADKWATDELGRAIKSSRGDIVIGGTHVGKVVVVEHADAETLIHFSSYSGTPVAQTYFSNHERNYREELLRKLASDHGFDLVPKV